VQLFTLDKLSRQVSLSLNAISICPFIRLEFDVFSSTTISDRRKKNWLDCMTSVLYSSIRYERREGGRREKQHLPLFSPPSHSIELLVPCVVNAMPLAPCCVVRNVYSRFNCPFLIYSLCLSISHQYAHWELAKKEIRLNRQTSVCIYESYGQHLIQFDE
jgi:hypothetical protein